MFFVAFTGTLCKCVYVLYVLYILLQKLLCLCIHVVRSICSDYIIHEKIDCTGCWLKVRKSIQYSVSAG